MRRTYRYNVNEKEIEREYNYIPFRYILAILITVFEAAATIGIVIILPIIGFMMYFMFYSRKLKKETLNG